MSYDLPKKFDHLPPKKFQNGIGELFKVTDFKPVVLSEHEKTIVSILTADDVDIYRPLKEIWVMVGMIQKHPEYSKAKIRQQLTSYLTISYNGSTMGKFKGIDDFVAYVKTHINK